MTVFAVPRPMLLAAVLARAVPHASPLDSPYFCARAINEAIRAAKTCKRNAERECSVPLTEAQLAALERSSARAVQRVRAALYVIAESTPGFYVSPPSAQMEIKIRIDHPAYRHISFVFGGDPRGPCGRMIIDDVPGDSMGGGFALYD